MKRGQIIRIATKEFKAMPGTYHGYKTIIKNKNILKPVKIQKDGCWYTSQKKIQERIAVGDWPTTSSSSLCELFISKD